MYVNIFRNRKRGDMDAAAYSADAAEMERLAAAQPGFLSFKSFVADDGEVVAISEWADEASARAWGMHPAHRVVQAKGRDAYYASYTSMACNNPRVSRYTMDDPA